MKIKNSISNLYVVAYDIGQDKRRNKVAKLLEQCGYERIQYSVFTGLVPPHRNKDLWKKIQKLIDSEEYPEDKIFTFSVSKNAFHNMKIIGNFTADTDYLLGIKNTEFF